MSRSLLLLLSISGLLALVSAQGFDLSFTRSSSLVNTLTLRCEDAETGSLVDDPVFFRDESLYPLPNRQDTANGVTFQVTRGTEGIYQCASDASVLPAQRSQQVSIVALPSGSNRFPVNPTLEFEFETGARARLDCPILPGALRSQYFVTWRSAANTGMVFYQVFPPDRSAPDVQLSDRYMIDNQNFSLYISEVTPGDMRFEYQCLLGVEDPRNPTMQGNEYTEAASVNLSLSILKPPEFIEPPRGQLVTSGENVTFTCAVLSSPRSSLIQWVHRGRLVDPMFDSRYDITSTSMPNSNLEVGGTISRSTLTILDVTGFDSDCVQCVAVYSITRTSVREDTFLSVLDLVEFQVTELQIGGFILRAQLKAPLEVPVQLRLLYTDTNNSQVIMTADTQYFNVSTINHVVSIDEVPFSTFTLSVAMVDELTSGPFNKSSIVYNRLPAPPTNKFEIGFAVTIGLLGLIVLLLVVVIVITSVRYRRLPESAKKVVAKNSKVLQQILGSCNGCNCNCCARIEADDVISPNGFTKESAQLYVEALEASVKFAQEDPVIVDALNKSSLLKATPPREEETVDAIVTKPSDATGPPNGAVVQFQIVQKENP